MSSIVALVIALIVILVIWKIMKGIIRTFGLLAVVAGALAYVYFTGGFG